MHFGAAAAALGPRTLAVGAPLAHGGGVQRGEVRIAALTEDGSEELAVIDSDSGLPLVDSGRFGSALCAVPSGGEEVVGGFSTRLAVGAPGVALNDAPDIIGVVYVLTLHANGSVAAFATISSSSPGFDPSPALRAGYQFGGSLAALDVDGDGTSELAVGAPLVQREDAGWAEPLPTASGTGTVFILFLELGATTASVVRHARIDGEPLITEEPLSAYRFALSLAAVPDSDGDGVPELAVGYSKTSSRPLRA